MAQNPKFNNNGMFTDASDDYSDITPDNKSEVLATQGNVINSIKVFWNKLRAKLAFAITRPDYDKAVGGNYQPVYIDENGVVQVCAPKTIPASIDGSNINIGNIPIHPGKTICIQLKGSLSASATPLMIEGVSVIYPSGAPVYPTDVHIDGTYLLTYMAGMGTNWILISSMNVADDTYPGLMTAAEHKKLHGIQEGANNYSLPIANTKDLGGVLSVATGTTANRDYNVQVNSDGTMKVNVPWTDTHEANWEANLRVGTANSTDNDTTSDVQETYIKTVENGEVHGRIKVVGTRGTVVSSTSSGELVIDSPTVPSYSTLKTDSWNNNYDSSTPYTVFGPGKSKATTDYYLRGDGSWGPVAASMGSMQASISNGTRDSGGFLSGTLKVTYNGISIQFALLNGSNYKISTNCSLSLQGTSVKSGALGTDTTALIIPIGYLSLKPQLLYFVDTNTVNFLDT